MKRIAELVLLALAAVLAAIPASRLASPVPPPAAAGSAERKPWFHEGKASRDVGNAGGCVAGGCHVGAPHRAGGSAAPFRNLHASYVDCLVCHASEGTTRVAGGKSGAGKNRLSFAGPPPPRRVDGHPALSPAAGCRACHSEAGARTLKSRGLSGLAPNFPDPIALRMLEGGGRRWSP